MNENAYMRENDSSKKHFFYSSDINGEPDTMAMNPLLLMSILLPVVYCTVFVYGNSYNHCLQEPLLIIKFRWLTDRTDGTEMDSEIFFRVSIFRRPKNSISTEIYMWIKLV